MTKYNKQYFIQKFEAIPEERWCSHVYRLGEKCCAYGHCGARDKDFNPDDPASVFPEEAQGLQDLFFRETTFNKSPHRINDGQDPNYPQETPKQRILAALRDLPDSDATA